MPRDYAVKEDDKMAFRLFAEKDHVVLESFQAFPVTAVMMTIGTARELRNAVDSAIKDAEG